MAAMKPKDAVEVLRRLRERLESVHEDLSDDERMALDYATEELRRLEGFPDEHSHDD